MFGLSFLNTIFLAGLATVAIPVLIHLLYKRQRTQVLFSSLRFLRKADEDTARRLRIREWLLLALRALIFILIALAFARPFLMSDEQETTERTDLLLLLDDSYSMQTKAEAGTRFELAKEKAGKELSALRDGDRAGLVTTASGGVIQQNLTEDLSLVKAALRGAAPTGHFCRYWPAFKKAHSLLSDSDGERKRLVFLTDGQLVSWDGMSQARSLEAAGQGLAVETVFVGGPGGSNLSLLDLQTPLKIWSKEEPLRLAARVANYSKLPAAVTVHVHWKFVPAGPEAMDRSGFQRSKSKEIRLEPGETATVPVLLRLERKDDVVGWAEVAAEDSLHLDDVRYFSVSAEDAIEVLCVEDWETEKPFLQASYYLRRALEPALPDETPRSSYVRAKLTTRSLLRTMDLKSFEVVVLADVSELDPLAADRVEAFVRAGGGLVLFVGEQTSPDFYNREAYRKGAGWLTAEFQAKTGDENRRERFWTLVPGDRGHELFRSYDEESWSELSSARFYRYLSVVPAEDASVLAVYDNDDPAIIERKVDVGRVILFTSTCNAEWTDFPKRGTYVPLVHQLVRYLSPRDRQSRSNLRLDEPLSAAFGGARSVRELEDLTARSIDGDQGPVMDPVPGPGLYQVLSADPPQVLRVVAANIDTRESNPATVDAAEAAWLISSGEPPDRAVEPGTRMRWEERGRLARWWRYLLLAVAALMLLELAIANEWI